MLMVANALSCLTRCACGGIRDVSGKGTHFMIPVIQRPIIIDVRTKPREIPSVTGTKDLQMVNIKMRVLWRPIVEQLPRLYRELGTDFDERACCPLAMKF
jgi:prohibitin 1